MRDLEDLRQAVMHYRATEESHAVIEGDGLLLIDSGGQYHGGTTDITRTVWIGPGEPPDDMKGFKAYIQGLLR